MSGIHCPFFLFTLNVLESHELLSKFAQFPPIGILDFILVSHGGIKSFAKLGYSIYFEEEGLYPGLYIIRYISSSLDWKSGHILPNQKVDPVVSSDPYRHITFTFLPKVLAIKLGVYFLTL